MTYRTTHVEETGSTNDWLREHAAGLSAEGGADAEVVWADFQTAGRGCGTNAWHSERGLNLLFSVLLRPRQIAAREQFLLSMAVSCALAEAVEDFIGGGRLSVKWPNDLYLADPSGRGLKMAGTLIENRLKGADVVESVVGVGLNVNQRVFPRELPNPTSMSLAAGGREFGREEVLGRVMARLASLFDHWNAEALRSCYRRRLFWGSEADGPRPFRDAGGCFEAVVSGVADDGRLLLRDTHGHERTYRFKEVEFLV